MRESSRFPGWLWLFPAIGVARVLGWVFAAGWQQGVPGAFTSLALVLSFCSAGILLVIAGRPRAAAVRLGGAFVLVASAFADPSTFEAIDTAPARLLAALRPSYLLPAFMWGFTGAFLRQHRSAIAPRDLSPWAVRLAEVAGVTLVVLHAVPHFTIDPSSLPRVLTSPGVAWLIVYVLVAGAFAQLIRGMRRARPEDRRRLSLFITGVVVGATPAVLGGILLLVIPALREFIVQRPAYLAAYRAASYLGLVAVPFITLYAVLSTRVLGLREVARIAIHAFLARQVALVLALAPLALAAAIGLRTLRTAGTVGLDPVSAVAILVIGSIGLIAVAFRRRILELVDTRLYPRQRAADHRLRELATELANVPSIPELAASVRLGLEDALGVSGACVMLLNRDTGRLESLRGEVRPLPVSRDLMGVIADRDVVRLGARPDLNCQETADWATASGIELLVVMRSAGPLGAVAVGPKMSELPLTREDHGRLARVAGSVKSAIDRLGEFGADQAATDVLALVCPECQGVFSQIRGACPVCGGPLQNTKLPLIVAGKFEVVRRVGVGGSGVVYAALDVDLGRSVAIKTLPGSLSGSMQLLRREARFMASLSHHSLATIYGLEMWAEQPLLVLEFFDQGSLKDRLSETGVEWNAALGLGIELAEGLEYLHAHRILHGDIKPSNVGVDAWGRHKLLDFGISRLLELPRRSSAATTTTGGSVPTDPGPGGGTVAYMPPETMDRAAVGPGIDLWGWAATIYETLTGTHPFADSSGRFAIGRLAAGEIADPRERVPDCPAALAQLLSECLAPSPPDRPASADAILARLRQVEIDAGHGTRPARV